jgi:hypothetical protein
MSCNSQCCQHCFSNIQHYTQSVHHNTVLDKHYGRFSFNTEDKYHSFNCHKKGTMTLQSSQQYKFSSNVVENLLQHYFEHYKFKITTLCHFNKWAWITLSLSSSHTENNWEQYFLMYHRHAKIVLMTQEQTTCINQGFRMFQNVWKEYTVHYHMEYQKLLFDYL